MEDISEKKIVSVEFKRSEWPTEIIFYMESDFRRRLSGVVFKPPYAAKFGNDFVVSDKEKRGERLL